MLGNIYPLNIVIVIIIIGLLLLLGWLLIEVIRTVMGVRRIVDRVEMVSDVKGWFDLVRRIGKSK